MMMSMYTSAVLSGEHYYACIFGLTLSMLDKKFSRLHFEIFSSFLPENRI